MSSVALLAGAVEYTDSMFVVMSDSLTSILDMTLKKFELELFDHLSVFINRTC